MSSYCRGRKEHRTDGSEITCWDRCVSKYAHVMKINWRDEGDAILSGRTSDDKVVVHGRWHVPKWWFIGLAHLYAEISRVCNWPTLHLMLNTPRSVAQQLSRWTQWRGGPLFPCTYSRSSKFKSLRAVRL